MKSAIVTGGADGLGADMAAILAANNYRVGILDVREVSLRQRPLRGFLMRSL